MRLPQDGDDNLVIDISDGFIKRRNGPFARLRARYFIHFAVP
jgi:hypothetical protein